MAADVAVGGLQAEYERRLREPSDIRDHLPVLRQHATGWQFPRVLELGTREGNSTAAFLTAVEKTGWVWSIDINPPQVPDEWHSLPCWRFLQADDLSPQARAWAPPVVEVLFIDTSHEYAHTLTELRVYGPRVRPGGVILLHDTEYGCIGGEHRQWIDPRVSEVGRAVDAYCRETGLSWVNRPGSYGLGVIKVGRDAVAVA